MKLSGDAMSLGI